MFACMSSSDRTRRLLDGALGWSAFGEAALLLATCGCSCEGGSGCWICRHAVCVSCKLLQGLHHVLPLAAGLCCAVVVLPVACVFDAACMGT